MKKQFFLYSSNVCLNIPENLYSSVVSFLFKKKFAKKSFFGSCTAGHCLNESEEFQIVTCLDLYNPKIVLFLLIGIKKSIIFTRNCYRYISRDKNADTFTY